MNKVSFDTVIMRKTIYILIVMTMATAMVSSLELVGLEQTTSPDTIEISNIKKINPIEQIANAPIAPLEAVPEPTPPPVVVPTPSTTESPATAEPLAPAPPIGSHTDWMAAAGIAEGDYFYVDYIVNHESSWRIAVSNGLGCVGLIQACPSGLKPRLLAECPNWEVDPSCQLRVASSYANGRYNSWAGAYKFWASSGWW